MTRNEWYSIHSEAGTGAGVVPTQDVLLVVLRISGAVD
jgi:hypothetical protein